MNEVTRIDPCSILVVEDNVTNMKLLEHALTIAGYRVATSSDGEGLVDLAVTSAARLILMDIRLPKRSGIELLGLLRRDPRTAQVPVIAVTAFADPESVISFNMAGFDQVIGKPISVHHLLGEVERRLAGDL